MHRVTVTRLVARRYPIAGFKFHDVKEQRPAHHKLDILSFSLQISSSTGRRKLRNNSGFSDIGKCPMPSITVAFEPLIRAAVASIRSGVHENHTRPKANKPDTFPYRSKAIGRRSRRRANRNKGRL